MLPDDPHLEAGKTHRNSRTPKLGISDRSRRTKPVPQEELSPFALPLRHGLWKFVECLLCVGKTMDVLSMMRRPV